MARLFFGAGAASASACGCCLGLSRGGDLELRGQRGVLGGLASGGLLETLLLVRLGRRGLRLVLGSALATEADVGDAQDRQVLAVALLDPAPGLGLVLESDDLVAARGADDLGLDGRTVDDGCADGGFGPVGDEEHPVQRDGLAGFDVEQLNLEHGADLDAVLLPAGLDDCVHGSSERAMRPRATATWTW